MKKSDATPFGSKTRQSYVAILLIIYKSYRIIVRQAWPFLIYFVIGGSGKKSHFLIGIIIFAVLGMVFSIIKFFRYYFYIKDDELVIEQGVLKKSKTIVPFERVQTINFEQNIIHRIFDVVKLKVDTAGSAGNELEFEAISHRTADQLREILLSKKQQKVVTSGDGQTKPSQPEYRRIMSLELPQLLRAGMVENHLKSGGLIFVAMFWIWQSADEVGMADRVEDPLSTIEYGLQLMSVLAVVFVIASFLISLVRMVIRNYELQFLRSSRGFKLQAGLFTRRDVSALDHKIQVISWADNPLKKLIGIKDLRLRQAASQAINSKKTIKIPGCTMSHLHDVTASLYGPHYDAGIVYESIHPAYFHRVALYVGLVASLLAGFFYYVGSMPMLAGVTVATVALLLTRYLSMKKKRYGINDQMLIIHGGSYGDKTEVLPIYKIQSCSLSRSPYQRRKGLASVVIHTASGRVGVPYVTMTQAQHLMDILLYRVERDHRKWM